MTQDEIIEMARQAGFLYGTMGPSNTRFVTAIGHTFIVELEAFAKLVAAAAASKERERVTFEVVNEAQRAVQEAILAEREACAKLVEDSWMAFSRASNVRLDITPFPELSYVAKVIRARGEA